MFDLHDISTEILQDSEIRWRVGLVEGF